MNPPKMPEPPGAYGPTQYPFIGMNCSFWADATVVAPNSARPSRIALLNFMVLLLEKPLNGVQVKQHSPDHSMCQWGNGHSRSFSLPICHSRASPCGSTARKK